MWNEESKSLPDVNMRKPRLCQCLYDSVHADDDPFLSENGPFFFLYPMIACFSLIFRRCYKRPGLDVFVDVVKLFTPTKSVRLPHLNLKVLYSASLQWMIFVHYIDRPTKLLSKLLYFVSCIKCFVSKTVRHFIEFPLNHKHLTFGWKVQDRLVAWLVQLKLAKRTRVTFQISNYLL